jgi:tRNA-Thr(GGU) m(6)t(6)A37 methyltransferase TsaA
MEKLICTPIGIIHSPFKDPVGTPIQPSGAKGKTGWVDVFPDYAEGLNDLEGFSHIILVYHFHLSQGFKLKVTPFLDDQPRGLFATRAPSRPNPIGLSVVSLVRIEGRVLHIENVDIIDSTPLLDIKPYVPHFDSQEKTRTGWLERTAHRAGNARADERFKA